MPKKLREESGKGEQVEREDPQGQRVGKIGTELNEKSRYFSMMSKHQT